MLRLAADAAAGDVEASHTAYETTLSRLEAEHGPDAPELSTPLNNFGVELFIEQKFERAAEVFARAYAIDREHMGPDDPRVAYPASGLGETLVELGRLDEAIPPLEDALRLWREDPDAFVTEVQLADELATR